MLGLPGRIGGEEGAGVLKEMLEKYLSPFNLSPLTRNSIAQSAVKIGGELGRGILKALLESAFKEALEKDNSPEMQAGIAEWAGENKMQEELMASVLANIDNKGFSPQVRDYMIESLGRIGEELRVDMLKLLLKKNPEPYILVIIAQSAGNIGGKEGATREAKEATVSILKEMLENDQLSFEDRSAIAYSAGMSGEAGAGMLKDLLEKNQLSSEAQSAVAYAASRVEYETGGMSILN